MWRIHVLLLLTVLGVLPLSLAGSSSPSLPRSKARRLDDGTSRQQQYWNPTPSIDSQGYLSQTYELIPGEWEEDADDEERVTAQVRQVPGDGNCLFHSLALGLSLAQNKTQWDYKAPDSLAHLYQTSQQLRQWAVACLSEDDDQRSWFFPRKGLYLQGREWLSPRELVTAAAQQYDMTAEEYVHAMKQDCVWGGGPEIVALCNALQRPIHVYELHSRNNKFVLRRMAAFGSPRFDRRQTLHILSADSRFPDVAPGSQLKAGNHFLALFPIEVSAKQQRRRRLRGGGAKLREDPASATDVSEPSRLSTIWPPWRHDLWKLLLSILDLN